MNTIIAGKNTQKTHTNIPARLEIGEAIDGGTPSESLLKFSGETVSKVPISRKPSESESILVEAIDGGFPTPELERIIQETNLLSLETATKSHHIEEAVDASRMFHPSKKDSIAKTIEIMDAGQCPYSDG